MTGHVYFLRCGDFVKIGYSETPEIRTRDINNATPYQVELIGTLPGTMQHEKALHFYFRHQRHATKREWFWLTDGIRDIASNGFPENLIVKTPVVTGNADAVACIDMAVAIFGTEAALARAGGVSQPTLHVARKTGNVGPKLAIAIERATNHAISRCDLRPDLWPREREAAE